MSPLEGHMARESRNKWSRAAEEQEEMTVVILRFKGGGETLRKGFDTVTEALAALGPAPRQRKLLSERGDGLSPSDTDEGLEDSAQDPDREFTEGHDGGADSARPRQRGGAREYSAPKFLSDLNLRPDGQTGWNEYAASKDPQTVNDKYLVASAWLTKHGGCENFTTDHLFTCFRAMEWEEQKDFLQPVRVMKSKKRATSIIPAEALGG